MVKNIKELEIDLEIFINHVRGLLNIYYIYSMLYESKNSHTIMDESAKEFFHDLNGMTIECTYLAISRLCDPAGRGKNTNISIDFFVRELKKLGIDVAKLENHKNMMYGFYEKIHEERNKKIAHIDRKTHHDEMHKKDSEKKLFQLGEEKEFMHSLEKFCDDLSTVITGETRGQYAPNVTGDVLDLLKVLKIGIKHNKIER